MAKKFRPKKWPTVATLTMFVLLEALGIWQIQRLHWKEALLQQIHDRMAQKPVPLPETIDNPDLWEYRRVTLAGEFLSDQTTLIKPRTLDGRVGYHMYTPFRRASGGIVFINRGWISDDLIAKATRPQAMMQVEGIVQTPHQSTFTPDNVPEKNDWYWPDLTAMAHTSQLDDPLPVVVNIAERQPDTYPAGGQVRVDLPNDHRQYAIFWFTMSMVLLVIYFLSQLKEEKE